MKRILRQFQRLKWSVRYHGLDLTILACAAKLLRVVGKDLTRTDWYQAVTARRFDRRFGVNTQGNIQPAQLDIDEDRKLQAIEYKATSSVRFGSLLSELAIDYRDYVFVDYGSGKGRALVMASDFPFKQIIGVELSRSLHEMAKENIRQYLTRNPNCHDIRSICSDATTFEPPDQPLVIYLFNPFKDEIMSVVLDNIRRSLRRQPRHIVVVYFNPVQRHLLDNAEFLAPSPMTPNDGMWKIYETNPSVLQVESDNVAPSFPERKLANVASTT